MQCRLMMITPAVAKAMLASTTTRNRKLNKEVVKLYADDMRNGRWQENGETIIQDDNGNVIDGQHRLTAVIMSGVTVRMIVATGVASECFKTIDKGRKRTHGDVLGIEGFADSRNLAALCAAVYTYERNGKFCPHATPADSRLVHRNAQFDVIREVSVRMPDIEKSMQVFRKWSKIPSKVSNTLAGSMHYIFAKIDSNDSDEFFRRMVDLEFAGKDDPCKRLYEMCTTRGTAEIMHSNAYYTSAIFVKAWNCFRKNTPCKLLRFNDGESFPVPV